MKNTGEKKNERGEVWDTSCIIKLDEKWMKEGKIWETLVLANGMNMNNSDCRSCSYSQLTEKGMKE